MVVILRSGVGRDLKGLVSDQAMVLIGIWDCLCEGGGGGGGEDGEKEFNMMRN